MITNKFFLFIKTTFIFKFWKIQNIIIFIIQRDEFVKNFDDFEDYDSLESYKTIVTFLHISHKSVKIDYKF